MAVNNEDERRQKWEEDADEEQIALSRHAEFRAMLARTAAAARRSGGLALDEVPAFRELTPEDEAEGERLLAELERQTEEEEAAWLAARRRNGRAAPDTVAALNHPPGGAPDPSLARRADPGRDISTGSKRAP